MSEAVLKPLLVVLFDLEARWLDPIAEAFEVIEAVTSERRASVIQSEGARVDAVLTTGVHGLTAQEIEDLPRLRFIGSYGAGYEAIDVAHAMQRGIVVFNGRGVNDSSVADHALALLLSAVRRIAAMDRDCRQGLFRDDLPLQDQLSGKRVGVVGMGRIGRKIARRLAAFDVEVGYHARHAVDDVPYAHVDTVLALAAWADHLVIAAPGGSSTHHMVTLEVLQALGVRGWIVNVGRGSIVDTEALATALRMESIAGAALDVYEGEPEPPESLLAFDNVILTPHVAGSSPQAMQAATALFLDNAARCLRGEPPATPVRVGDGAVLR